MIPDLRTEAGCREARKIARRTFVAAIGCIIGAAVIVVLGMNRLMAWWELSGAVSGAAVAEALDWEACRRLRQWGKDCDDAR